MEEYLRQLWNSDCSGIDICCFWPKVKELSFKGSAIRIITHLLMPQQVAAN